MTDTYLLDHGWEHEHERLLALGATFDPGTRRALAATGLAPGWRCLEVAAGAGTVARWLAEQVGEHGTVVATDLDTGFLEKLAGEVPNLEARRHNIVTDPVDEGTYDLVHTRFLLEHLHSRQEALANMARAVRPGGWLVAEALQWTTPHIGMATGRPGRHPRALVAQALSPVVHVLLNVFKDTGLRVDVGAQLPADLARLGLTEITAEGRAVFVTAGTPGADVVDLSLQHARDLILDPPAAMQGRGLSPARLLSRAPALKAVLGRRLDAMAGIFGDPAMWTMLPVVVAAAGRRPLT